MPPLARLLLLSLLSCFITAPTLRAQDIPPFTPGDEQTTFTNAQHVARLILSTLREECAIPGMSAAVNVQGQTVWQEGFGYANIEQRSPATPHTRFRLASISKALTGVAVASLAHDNTIDLDQPIEQLIPECPPQWHTITIRQLMGHTAGIRNYKPEERDDLNPQQRDTTDQALGMIRTDPLVHPPGELFTYTTLGYIIVRAAIEQATDKPFMQVIQERVLNPASMLHTSADRHAGIIPNRASLYHFIDGSNGISDATLINAPHTNLSYKPAGGGMIATAADLTNLGHALAANTILAPSARQELWKHTLSNAGERYDYGLGWGLATDTQNQFYAVQIGGQIGAGSALVIYPQDDVSAAILTNRAAGPIARSEAIPIARLFRAANQGQPIAFPTNWPQGFFDLTVTDQHQREYVGRMQLATRRGLPTGEILLQATDNQELRRFRIATAINDFRRENQIRIYAIHQDWGLFPFVIQFDEHTGSLKGRLDRQTERWQVQGNRALAPKPEAAGDSQ